MTKKVCEEIYEADLINLLVNKLNKKYNKEFIVKIKCAPEENFALEVFFGYKEKESIYYYNKTLLIPISDLNDISNKNKFVNNVLIKIDNVKLIETGKFFKND